MLDVDSGAGLFTNRLLGHVCKNPDSTDAMLELAMLGKLSADPDRCFHERTLRNRIAGIKYIRSDYAEGIQGLAAKHARQPKFNTASFLRMLNNLSEFSVTATVRMIHQ